MWRWITEIYLYNIIQIIHLLIKKVVRLFFLVISITSLQSHALVGGDSADASDYPGLVILNAGGIETPAIRNCTGIVLEPKRILTIGEECLFTYTISDFNFIPLIVNFLPESIFVHPVSNGEFSGDILYPVVKPLTNPGIRASAYKLSKYRSLGILYLEENIVIEPATLYEGDNNFITESGTAIGWEQQQSNAGTTNYVIKQLSMNFIGTGTNGETGPDIADNDCIESSIYLIVEICAGYRNGINYFEWQLDKGARSTDRQTARQ